MVAVYIVFKKKEKIHKKFYIKMESMTTGGYLHFLLKSDTHVYYCAPNMEWGSEYHTSPVFQ